MLQLLRAHVRGAGEGHRVIDHINLKIFVAEGNRYNLADAVAVFHQWIRDGVCPEMLIDVADYRHVPAGPGVMLIGHEANYSLDNRENRLGLLYNRKAVLDGTFQSKLAQAWRAATDACDRLEKEGLKFDRNTLEFFVNDRLLAPNTEATWQTIKPQLETFFPGFDIERRGEPRDLFRVSITRT